MTFACNNDSRQSRLRVFLIFLASAAGKHSQICSPRNSSVYESASGDTTCRYIRKSRLPCGRGPIEWLSAAFPKGSLCLQIADEPGSIYTDDQFSALFPHRGKHAEAPGRLALATVLQFVEGLSDRRAADAVRGRIDWKYAFGFVVDRSRLRPHGPE